MAKEIKNKNLTNEQLSAIDINVLIKADIH